MPEVADSGRRRSRARAKLLARPRAPKKSKQLSFLFSARSVWPASEPTGRKIESSPNGFRQARFWRVVSNLYHPLPFRRQRLAKWRFLDLGSGPAAWSGLGEPSVTTEGFVVSPETLSPTLVSRADYDASGVFNGPFPWTARASGTDAVLFRRLSHGQQNIDTIDSRRARGRVGRRATQRALAEIGAHPSAKRRNDLAPRLELLTLPTESLKPASRRPRRRDAVKSAGLTPASANSAFVARS